jgi:hypothetical protein
MTLLELAKFKAGLAQFTGTEHYYFNPLYRDMKYTDGVNYLAATAGAYWLLDMIGAGFFPKQKSGEWDSFVVIKLTSEQNAMLIQVQDGNHNDYLCKTIQFTDFPEGEWALWLIDGVLLLPSEY